MHTNLDVLKAAGLVKDGKAISPTSPEELLAQAKAVKDKTGKYYWVSESGAGNVNPVRLWLALVWQQGGSIFTDGKVTIDTPEGLAAAKLLKQMYDDKYINSADDYASAQQAFLGGNAAYMPNGTWVVNNYNAAAADPANGLKDYAVDEFPTLFSKPATFGGVHAWVVPTDPNRPPERMQAILTFMKFLNDHNGDWARAGSISVRKSVLKSAQYNEMPHRAEYVGAADITHTMPKDMPNQLAVIAALANALSPMWLTGESPEKAMADAQMQVERAVR